MKSALKVAFVIALGACSTAQQAEQTSTTPAAVATASPSPRAECAPAQVTLYFAEEVASDEPVVTPLLNDFMDHIRACEAAGGELRGITIAASADPDLNSTDSRAQIQRRQDRVRAALVNLGAPADKITGAAARTEAIMGRRAEITADLY